MTRFAKSRFSAILLNLLIPGLGHVYWKEFTFGIFIFLIMLIAAMLFLVTFFIQLPLYAVILLTALPLVFYFFTFIDLSRVVKSKARAVNRTGRVLVVFLLVGLAYQLVVPLAPGNFAIRNRPSFFTMKSSDFSPLFRRGEMLKVSRLAYVVDIFFLKKPVLHALPSRYDIVRFVDDSSRVHTGIVVGLPGEEIEIAEGVVVVNGFPDPHQPAGNLVLLGQWPLTTAGSYSILVATLHMGMVTKVYEIPLANVVGKVEEPL